MRANRMKWVVALVLFVLGTSATVSAEEPRAEVTVRGFGFFGNRELRRTLELLLDDGKRHTTWDAGFIEDASLVLNSAMVDEGFFDARVRARWRTAEGGRGEAVLDSALSEALPRPLEVTKVRFDAMPGLRAVVDSVEIEGLEAIPSDEAKAFFMPDTGLFTPDAERAWSPARVARAAEQLREALRARGLAEAAVLVETEGPEPKSGRVRLRVLVTEGPRWRVSGWRAEVGGGGELLGGEPPGLTGALWSATLAVDAAQATRRAYFKNGYADARVEWRAEPSELVVNGERAVTAVARVEPGPRWTIGDVRFEGNEHTRKDLLALRTRGLVEGEPYDPAAVDAARLRLARLGVFRRVEPKGGGESTGGRRDVVFEVLEEADWQASWLIGYGSYEQLRGVLELSRGNLWGLAHRDRLEVGQSMKASRGEYRYTVPTLFNDTVEGSMRLFGLRREEPSFLRLEYGAGAELSRTIPWVRARGTAGVSYGELRAKDVELGATTALANVSVAALNFGLTRDVRDNPIRPRRGYRWAVQTETALPELGGDARYERVELSCSWHRSLGAERWLHAGVSHGFVAGGKDQVPVNKLFFPGGGSSIRGYPEGEATQRDGSGLFVGVRSAWLVNLEFEQLITGSWTLVLFGDVLGTAVDMSAWPSDEVLSSVGAGVRFQSPIGPLRIEYGRNLNRREGDPVGTLHFSIGFPF